MSPNGPEHPDWLPVGEEPQTLGTITHCRVLRGGGISLLTTDAGDVDAGEDSATGAYARDTRYLSRLRFSFSGVAPILLDSREPESGLSATFTNPAILVPTTGEVIPAQTLMVRRRTLLADGLLQRLVVSNYSPGPVICQLRLDLDADFHDIFEVRGIDRQSPRPPVTTAIGADCVDFTFTGVDGRTRTSSLVFEPAPDHLSASRAIFDLPLAPRQTAEIMVRLGIDGPAPMESIADATLRVSKERAAWLESVTAIETDNTAINDLVGQCLADIHSLRTEWVGMPYLAAGVPWFDTLFGRDSLIAGIQLAAFAPGLLREALRVLAQYQAVEEEPRRDAMPGKIPHELRWGELAQAGEVPFARYYGSVDSTPLFVLALAEYMRWTNDQDLLDELWPNVGRAIAFLRDQASRGVGGFLSYSRETAAGLENQGWKDSHDAIVHPDGTHSTAPISLVEVQGYYAAALSGYADLAMIRGDLAEAASAAHESALHVRRLEEAFGDADLGFALALDGAGKPAATPASNAGHVLWAGASSRALAATVKDRLMRPDMFTGWGIRTLSSSVNGYNPLGYHVGSVWPHDNSLTLAGFRRYGFDDAAETLGNALISMALAFPEYRVPELFSGDQRDLRLVPTPYPVASRPQAWAAATIPYVLISMLGLRPGLPNQLVIARPTLPDGVTWLRVRGLRLGVGHVDLVFRRHERRVSVEIEHLAPGLEVVLSHELPDRPPG